jgi:predicted aldo/keto reductase-like oxidoreductase
MMDGDWPEKMKGRMDALSEAKEKGHIRAVGCSYHNYDALKAAANVDWVDINLVRVNPYALHMDIEKKEEVPAFVQTLEQLHAKGQAIYGMKILGQGELVGDQIDNSLRFALSKPYIDGFTIGFSQNAQIDDIVRRIDRVAVKRG